MPLSELTGWGEYFKRQSETEQEQEQTPDWTKPGDVSKAFNL